MTLVRLRTVRPFSRSVLLNCCPSTPCKNLSAEEGSVTVVTSLSQTWGTPYVPLEVFVNEVGRKEKQKPEITTPPKSYTIGFFHPLSRVIYCFTTKLFILRHGKSRTPTRPPSLPLFYSILV